MPSNNLLTLTNQLINKLNCPLLFNTDLKVINENIVYTKDPYKPYITLNLNNKTKCNIIQELEDFYKIINTFLHKSQIAILASKVESQNKIDIFIVRLKLPDKEQLNWKPIKLF